MLPSIRRQAFGDGCGLGGRQNVGYSLDREPVLRWKNASTLGREKQRSFSILEVPDGF